MKSPKSRSEETMNALIDAVIRLLDRRAADAVSVRDIAAEAGVNHGLVHHYFGSKEALVREAIRRTNDRVSRERPGAIASAWSFGLFRAHPELARVVARVCLDGPRDLLALAAPPREEIEARARDIAAGAERLGIPLPLDPHVVSAGTAAALIGWFVFKPLLEAGWNLPADADEQLARALEIVDATFRGPRQE
jgi:AcrR family transcriptional regulator